MNSHLTPRSSKSFIGADYCDVYILQQQLSPIAVVGLNSAPNPDYLSVTTLLIMLVFTARLRPLICSTYEHVDAFFGQMIVMKGTNLPAHEFSP
jgi:hypothetical protein